MNGSTELPSLAGLVRELERLGALLRSLEDSLSSSLDPAAAGVLLRLARGAGHLEAARGALAGEAVPMDSSWDHLQGSTRTVPIQDLLSFLASTQKSGVLRVEAERERFLLQLHQGAVVYAGGDAPPEGQSLPALLSRRGVSSAELLGTLPDRSPEGMWVDRNLVGTSWISRDALTDALQEQTRLSFFRLCAAGPTRFRFHEGAEIQNVLPVRQSAMELLLEYTRVADERESRGAALQARPLAPPLPAPRRGPFE